MEPGNDFNYPKKKVTIYQKILTFIISPVLVIGIGWSLAFLFDIQPLHWGSGSAQQLENLKKALPDLEQENPDMAQAAALQVINLADSLRDNISQSYAYFWYAKALLTQHKDDEDIHLALSFARIGNQLLVGQDAPKLKLHTLGQIASIYTILGDPDSMQYYAAQAWEMLDQLDTKKT
jgi:hypothetical protein